MKNIIAIAILFSTTAGRVFSQTGLGVDKAAPSQKLDINGWLEVGNESAPGTGSAGTIRYHSSGKLQFHNGSGWVNVGVRTVNFINWGRNDCPSGTSLVYTGQVGGSYYDLGTGLGSGYNTLCLSPTPNYVDFNDGNHNGALVYGLEYEVGAYGVSSFGGIAASTLQDREAVCAVCKAHAAVVLMVPGSTLCPSGWTQQYWGYLVSTHYTQTTSEWVCLNNTPILFGSTANSNGDLWYPTEAELCALRAPYVQNREITCSVCTR